MNIYGQRTYEKAADTIARDVAVPRDMPAARYYSKKTLLALEHDLGIDQLHACGGNARCTTCRVEFIDGEPDRMTVAERDVLAARGLSGIRLSCQIVCDQAMTVRAISRLAGSARKDVGPEPAAEIQPPPEWINK